MEYFRAWDSVHRTALMSWRSTSSKVWHSQLKRTVFQPDVSPASVSWISSTTSAVPALGISSEPEPLEDLPLLHGPDLSLMALEAEAPPQDARVGAQGALLGRQQPDAVLSEHEIDEG